DSPAQGNALGQPGPSPRSKPCKGATTAIGTICPPEVRGEGFCCEDETMKLAGRSAIITGGSQGLGRAIARHFLQEGASVLLVARGAAPLQQVEQELAKLAGPGEQVLTFRGDVGDPACCAAAAILAVERLPSLCVLVNNAGIQGPIGLFEEVDWE